jgi:hypothetical protein
MDGSPTGLPPMKRYREYLVLLARGLWYPRLRTKLDPSDVAVVTSHRAVTAWGSSGRTFDPGVCAEPAR